jgi:hypothetical protein
LVLVELKSCFNAHTYEAREGDERRSQGQNSVKKQKNVHERRSQGQNSVKKQENVQEKPPQGQNPANKQENVHEKQAASMPILIRKREVWELKLTPALASIKFSLTEPIKKDSPMRVFYL